MIQLSSDFYYPVLGASRSFNIDNSLMKSGEKGFLCGEQSSAHKTSFQKLKHDAEGNLLLKFYLFFCKMVFKEHFDHTEF